MLQLLEITKEPGSCKPGEPAKYFVAYANLCKYKIKKKKGGWGPQNS